MGGLVATPVRHVDVHLHVARDAGGSPGGAGHHRQRRRPRRRGNEQSDGDRCDRENAAPRLDSGSCGPTSGDVPDVRIDAPRWTRRYRRWRRCCRLARRYRCSRSRRRRCHLARPICPRNFRPRWFVLFVVGATGLDEPAETASRVVLHVHARPVVAPSEIGACRRGFHRQRNRLFAKSSARVLRQVVLEKSSSTPEIPSAPEGQHRVDQELMCRPAPFHRPPIGRPISPVPNDPFHEASGCRHGGVARLERQCRRTAYSPAGAKRRRPPRTACVSADVPPIAPRRPDGHCSPTT